jgi:hypothetical protein
MQAGLRDGTINELAHTLGPMGNRSEQLVGGDEPSAERMRNGFDDK